MTAPVFQGWRVRVRIQDLVFASRTLLRAALVSGQMTEIPLQTSCFCRDPRDSYGSFSATTDLFSLLASVLCSLITPRAHWETPRLYRSLSVPG